MAIVTAPISSTSIDTSLLSPAASDLRASDEATESSRDEHVVSLLDYTGTESMVATGEAVPLDTEGGAPVRAPVPSAAARDPRSVGGSPTPMAAPIDRATKLRQSPAEATAPAHDRGRGAGSRGPLRRYQWPALGLVLVVAAAVAAVIVLTSGGSSAGRGQLFEAVLRPVPANHVTGRGTATVRLRGNLATVTVDTTGLLNGSSHPMHIHAFRQGICPPAAAARLHNGHRSISGSDGIPYYGPVVYSLTESGDTSSGELLDFPKYQSTGSIHYKRTFTISSAVAGAIRDGDAAIAVHGIDYNHNGIYDDVLGLDGAVPQEASDPALCGTLFNTQP